MSDLCDLYQSSSPDDVAIHGVEHSSERLTYGELYRLALDTGSALRTIGLEDSDKVVIVMPNGPLMATSFLCFAPWVATAPLNPAYTADEFAFYLDDLEPSLVVVQEGDSSPVIAVAEQRSVPFKSVRWPHAGSLFDGEFKSDTTPIERVLDSVALILHTSGTTSRPKMVPLTQRNLLASARNISSTLNLTSTDRCMNIMPLFHIHGLMAPILATIYAGASVACSPGFNALKFYQWLDQVKPTWYSAVPTMHQAILTRANRNRSTIDSSHLRFIRSSSASLPPQVLHQLETTFNTRVVEAYAMTEAAHQMCSNPLLPKERKPGTVGPAAGPDVSISDISRLIFLDRGEEGEVVIRGENVTSGYINNPEANQKDFVDGWFRTGDLGVMDEDGYVKITGRLKEIINRGGEKIAPVEVDEVLLDHEGVAQACTFALPHEKLGEEVAAIVVLESGKTISEREIQTFVGEHLAAFKVPRTIVFLDEIPKGATGKVQRIGMADRLGLGAS